MKAIRRIVKSDNAVLNISLPSDFWNKHLELIILPFEQQTAKEEKDKLEAYKDFILNLPLMNDAQFNSFTEKD